MIRLTTIQADTARLARHRRIVAVQLAEAVEAMPYEVCAHNDRPSCPKCATRAAVLAAARVVRETGGVS
jgi:hypothetical protein